MKHIHTFESFINEAEGLAYWSDYEKDTSGQADKWMSEPCKTTSDVVKCIDKSIAAWNKESEEGPISKEVEKHVGELAMQYFKQFKMINGNIISAMIAQES